MKYSSTVLKRFAENCPFALDQLERDVPYTRDHFETGIAAHAVLQVVGEKGATTPEEQSAVAEAVVDELITVGREFDGKQEPPMSPASAFEGRDIALNYLAYNDMPDDPIAFERGLGMRADGSPCQYSDDDCRYRAVIDVIYPDVIGDEDWSVNAIVIRDFKTAWPTGESELDTLQRRGQAALAYRHIGLFGDDVQAIRMEVVNLRTGQPFSRDIMLDDDGCQILEGWCRDILKTCKAADQARTPRPGAGCLSCDYAYTCEHAFPTYSDDVETYAEELVRIETRRAEVIKVLKAKAGKDKAEVFPIDGGYVGWKVATRMTPVKDVHRHVIEYSGIEETSDLSSLLAALKLGKSQVDNFAKVYIDGDADLNDFNGVALDSKSASEFGVHKC